MGRFSYWGEEAAKGDRLPKESYSPSLCKVIEKGKPIPQQQLPEARSRLAWEGYGQTPLDPGHQSCEGPILHFSLMTPRENLGEGVLSTTFPWPQDGLGFLTDHSHCGDSPPTVREEPA